MQGRAKKCKNNFNHNCEGKIEVEGNINILLKEIQFEWWNYR
jgi:hypothetical protein